MELLQFLLSFLSNSQNKDLLNDIINLFKNGSFDMSNILSLIKPEMLAPFINSFFTQAKTPHPNSYGRGVGFEPIINIADKDIVYSLNRIMAD